MKMHGVEYMKPKSYISLDNMYSWYNNSIYIFKSASTVLNIFQRGKIFNEIQKELPL
jgi:hypothetical protein